MRAKAVCESEEESESESEGGKRRVEERVRA
jgi:hypothetical protein